MALGLLFGAAPPMASMMGFGFSEAGSPSYSSFHVPILGSLHRRYTGIPPNASCEVIIDVRASSVNPSDIHPNIALDDFPKVLGSDVAGVVKATGDGCNRLKPGDRVWGDIGANALTKAGKTKELGGYAPQAVALEAQLSRIPCSLSFAEAGSLPKVALTSYKALTWYAGAPNAPRWKRPDSYALVLGGSGGTGTTGIQLAKAFGAATVATTTSAANSAYVKKLGADIVIDYHSSNWWEPAVIPDSSVDVIYDTVGENGTGDRAMTKLRPGGFYVTITGQLATTVRQQRGQAFFINSDTNLASAPLLEDLSLLAAAGKLRMPFIDSTFNLSAVADAFSRSRSGHVVGKISITVQ